MFWTQAAGLTHLGRAHSSRMPDATMTDSTTVSGVIRRRTSARQVVRTRDGCVRGGFVLATWLIERASRPVPLRLAR